MYRCVATDEAHASARQHALTICRILVEAGADDAQQQQARAFFKSGAFASTCADASPALSVALARLAAPPMPAPPLSLQARRPVCVCVCVCVRVRVGMCVCVRV